jgi:hypothetical protein
MANKLTIWQDMTPRARKPFRIVETFPTLDGYRTRMSSLCFETLEEAHHVVMAMEARDGH